MFSVVKKIVEGYIKDNTLVITPETSLLSDLDINSLELVELVDIFEEKFLISIDPKDMYRFITINDVVVFIEEALERKS